LTQVKPGKIILHCSAFPHRTPLAVLGLTRYFA
jgi:hypothetical protein